MIKVKNLSKSYGDISILKNISLEIAPTEFVSLVGPSGAGKSTLIKLLIREEFPTSGNIFIENEDITLMPLSFLPNLRRKIGMIFQDFKLLPDRTVFENVSFALEVAGAEDSQIFTDVPKVLKIVGLYNKRDSFPLELSGGEQQRIATARALVHRPSILIADEPTGNLDPFNTWEIIRLLIRINELGTTVVLATHDKEIINALKRRVIFIKDGKVIRDDQEGRYML